MTIPFPVLENKELVDIGFLTAGYLMWFSAIGYSWIFQNHLDCVREQIINPDRNIIKNKYVFTINSNHELWYGIAHIGSEYVPAFGINDYMVVYPPSDSPDLYKSLKPNYNDVNIFKISPFMGCKEQIAPVILMYDDRVLIAPDALENLKKTLTAVIFTKDNPKGYFLTPTSEDEFEKYKNEEDTVIIELTNNKAYNK